jgi:signal transduction histidine kinase/ActR/RegA family two-component response regulator
MIANSIESRPPYLDQRVSACGCEPHGKSNGLIHTEGTRARDLNRTPTIDHHRTEDAQRFLLEISAEFVSRDYETTLKRLATRVVPFLADFCFIDVLSVDGILQRVGRAHTGAINHELFAMIDAFVPALSSIGHPVSEVLRTGQSSLVAEVTESWMRRVATSEQHFEFMRDLELCSLMAVPLLVAARTLGVLTFCYSAKSGRHYSQEDLWLAEDLARRAALVVENSRLYRELQDAAHRKDEFLAILGHELRNPLAPIRSAMQIFQIKCASDSDFADVAGMVERQVQQLTRLVDDLLDVSRVGHGKINLEMKPTDLKDVLDTAVEVSRPLIKARNHTLKVSLPERPVEVAGDAGRLAQVVSNLLNNSAKYSEDGGRIELTLEEHGNEAVVRVSDNGIGIDPSMLPTIFDLFAQVKSSTSLGAEGLGIGLAVVRNIIDLHGGCVQATSAGLGHGTSLVVRLPLLRRLPAGDLPAQNRPCASKGAATRRILVVDDNKDAADSMAILLRLAGHEVQTAYDGKKALILARQQVPEIVICDISMPDMCGLELARQLRQDSGLRDSLLVALSGYARDEDRRRSQEAGFSAHLAKPVRLDTLKALLASEHLVASARAEVNTASISAH